MIACSSTSRGPAIRIASGSRLSTTGSGLVVVVDQCPIAADAGVMVDVARLGHADDRVDQQAAADLLGRPLGQLFVGPVQRVPGLEGDDPAPAQRLKVLRAARPACGGSRRNRSAAARGSPRAGPRRNAPAAG